MQDTAGSVTTTNADGGAKSQRANAIRALNDQLRVRGLGGLVLMTDGVAAFDVQRVNRIFAAVAQFASFNQDNDPNSEHDFGSLNVEGIALMWKIDYYDRRRRFASPDPADPAVTTRVMTVMLAEEY